MLLAVGRLFPFRNEIGLVRIRSFVGRRAEGQCTRVPNDGMESGTLQDILTRRLGALWVVSNSQRSQ